MKKVNRSMCIVWIMMMFGVFADKDILAAQADTADVRAFETMIDGAMKKAAEQYHFAGAVVAVVKDGEIFFEKGYGYADVEKQIPVNPDTTAFQIASVTKVFTATAVMQLVGQGKLALDTDVNRYLTAFEIRNPFPTPVTLRHLLTHTAGFDDTTILFYKSSGDLLYDALEPLGKHLEKTLPPIIREPGTFWQYSSYGMALAGYIVELASGMPLEQYMTENLFKPLQMNNSAYWLTKDELRLMSKAYFSRKGKYVETAYTIDANHPSGSVCATASDMAHVLILHLNRGIYQNTRILDERAANEMHQRQYSGGDNLFWMGYGLFGMTRNGYAILGHGGYLPPFGSLLSFMPEQNIGLFISVNTEIYDNGKVKIDLANSIYDFFVAAKKEESPAEIESPVPLTMDANKINGFYVMESFGHTDLSKLKSVLMTCKITADAAGTLTVRFGGKTQTFRHIGNGEFYNAADKAYCRLIEQNGEMVYVDAVGMHEKIPAIHIYIFYSVLISWLLFLIAAVGLAISLIRRRATQTRPAMRIKSLFLLVSMLILVYPVANGFLAAKSIACDTAVVFDVIMPLIKIICGFTLFATIAAAFAVLHVWLKRQFSWLTRIWYSILTSFAVINLVFMYLMNGLKW